MSEPRMPTTLPSPVDREPRSGLWPWTPQDAILEVDRSRDGVGPGGRRGGAQMVMRATDALTVH